MTIRRLPEVGSEEARLFCQRWDSSDHAGKLALCKLPKYAVAYATAKEFRMKNDIPHTKPSQLSGEIDPQGELPVINIPGVKLKYYKPVKRRGKGDPETQNLIFGDLHAGEKTPTYNKDVLKVRVSNLYEDMLTITHLHRNMYPINELNIFFVGDMVHGENPHKGGTLDNTECSAQQQVFDIAMPELYSFITSCRQEFAQVNVYGVPGNHGQYSKESPKTSNWDLFLYKALAATLGKEKGIHFDIATSFCQIVQVQGFKFFIFHGDQARSYQGIPYFALIRKVLSWYITYGGFDYAVSGHWHKDDLLRVSARTKLFINGPFPTDDPFALEVIGTSAIPCQWTFGVHARQGLTWSYSLITDSKFVPSQN